MNEHRPTASLGLRLVAAVVILGTIIVGGGVGSSAQTTEAGRTVTNLTLLNGWTNGPFSTRAARSTVVSGVVNLSGGIADGTDSLAFRLPAGQRPNRITYVPVDLCDGAIGRLVIQPDGAARVETLGAFADAQCFTSLEGVSFILNRPGMHDLALQNGWVGSPYNTRAARSTLVSGIVHLSGAIADGTTDVAFQLPPGQRPNKPVYVPVDMCEAANGRLEIDADGTVRVQAQADFTDAQCFTSLEGASFSLNGPGMTNLTLLNGWTNGSFGARNARAKVVSGIVHLSGGIEAGTTTVPFRLPVALRPNKQVYLRIDLCGATRGRLRIRPGGVVSIETATFGDAQCFTSLEGASYPLFPN